MMCGTHNLSKIILAFIVLSFTPLSQATERLVLAYENTANYPYYTGEGSHVNDPKPGASIELLRLLEDELAVKVEFQRYDWPTCQTRLKEGQVDGIFNASFRSDRLAIGVYPMDGDAPRPSKRIDTISYVLYKHHHSALRWDTVSKKVHGLEGTIGAPTGYSIVKDLKGWQLPVTDTNLTPVDLDLLKNGQVGAVAALERSGDYFLRVKPELARYVVKVNPPLITKHYYLMLSNEFYKKHPELAEQIWDGIERLRERHLESILFRYFR